MHLRKRLIASMQANELEALKGGTRSQSDLESVPITICPGYMFCEHNMSA
ncbi:hypothetical protein [Kordia jejudonensis]|nr:hypothetical protein [Kordia jejudonensis]